MKTTVINIRSLSPGDLRADDIVYIGRESKGYQLPESPFHNPFPMRGSSAAERERVIQLFRTYLFDNPALVVRARMELRGKRLVCYCAPKPCHGDLLAEIANMTDEEFKHLCWLYYSEEICDEAT